MNLRRTSILALFVVAAVGPLAAADDMIVVAAQEAEATVSPRPARMRVVDLPPLTFEIRAAIRCAGEAVSVTLSVADTFVTRDREDLDGQRATEVSLTVPAQQLAMASSRRFCIADDPETDDGLLAQGFATAHASLRCENESGISVHYSSAPLNLKLDCAREPVADEVDQELSSGAR